MMKLKHIVLDTKHVAQTLLEYWTPNPEKVMFWRASSNFVYRFENDHANFFLRFIHEEDKDYAQIEAEMDFLLYLKKSGYPCATPVFSKEDKLIHTVETEFGVFHGVVFETALGKVLEFDELTQEHIKQWGSLLGKLHNLSSQYNPKGVKRRGVNEILQFIEGVFINHPHEVTALQALEKLTLELQNIFSVKEGVGLIHYDFESDNLLLDQSTGKMTVIDFDDCMYHLYAMDVERCLNCITQESPANYQEYKDTFLHGYTMFHEFGAEAEKECRHLKAFAEVFRMARILRAMDDSEAEGAPEWYLPMKKKLAGILDKCRRQFDVYLGGDIYENY